MTTAGIHAEFPKYQQLRTGSVGIIQGSVSTRVALLWILCVLGGSLFFSVPRMADRPPSPTISAGEVIRFDGDWIVTTSVIVADRQILMEGSILIRSGGDLTLRNVDLVFGDRPQGNSRIEVEGGQLSVEETRISDCDGILVREGSAAVVIDSTLVDFQIGLHASRANVRVEHSRFLRGATGLVYEDMADFVIRDVILDQIGETGIHLINCRNITLLNNSLRSSGHLMTDAAIQADSCREIVARNNTLLNFRKSMFWINTSYGIMAENYCAQTPDSTNEDGENLWMSGTNHILIENNLLVNLTFDAIEIYESSHFLIRNNTVIGTAAGIHIEYFPLANITIRENWFIDTLVLVKDVEGLVLFNNTFIRSAITLFYCSGVQIVNNYINVQHISLGYCTDVVMENNFDGSESISSTSTSSTLSSSSSSSGGTTENSPRINGYTPVWLLIGGLFGIIFLRKRRKLEISGAEIGNY